MATSATDIGKIGTSSTRNAPNASANVPANAPRDLASTISPSLRLIITITVMAATLMEVLDTSIVNVALPDMMGNLGATLDEIGWVSTGYIISNVIVLPLTGWLSDLFGRKRYLTYSVILFTLASLGCGLSRSLWPLVFWRVVQGMGGAAFLSTSQATLMEIYPPHRRGFAQAMFGIGVVMAPTLGPMVGGLITDKFSWPWIFFVNIPIGIVAAFLCFNFIPDSQSAGKKRRADFAGIGLLALGLGSLQTILERGERDDWFHAPYIVALGMVAVLGMATFIWWELHPKNVYPAVNLRTLTNRNLAAGTMMGFALGFVLYGGVFVLPQFLQTVQHHTAAQTGLLLVPGGLATACMMPIVGQLSNRIDKRWLIAAGALVFISSMLMFSTRFTLTMPDSAMTLPLILRGAGMGLQFVPISLLALGTLQPRQMAEGAGLYNLFRQLGGSFGIAILATLVDRRSHFHIERLSEHVSLYNPATQERLAAIQSSLAGRGYTADAAQQMFYQIISNTVRGQALVMTYADIFRVMAYVGIGAMLMLFLFQRSKNAPGAATAAHEASFISAKVCHSERSEESNPKQDSSLRSE